MIHKTNPASVPGKSLVSYFFWQCADLGSSKPHLTTRAAANVHLTVTARRKLPPLVSVKRIISGGSLIHPQWHAQVRKPTDIWWCSLSPVWRKSTVEPVPFYYHFPYNRNSVESSSIVVHHISVFLSKHWKLWGSFLTHCEEHPFSRISVSTSKTQT